LHTGKTHQIRAHLAHIGCPIVGDMKYGDELQNKSLGVARQCLIAKELSFHLDKTLSYLNTQKFISKFSL
jgi:23S rRNA pseudouridine955/2504/2580 synthase